MTEKFEIGYSVWLEIEPSADVLSDNFFSWYKLFLILQSRKNSQNRTV